MIRVKSWAAGAAVAAVIPVAALAGTAGSATAAVATQAVAHRHVPLCAAPPRGYAHCHGVLNQAVTASGQPAPNATTAPTGLSPSQYVQAYNWANIGNGSGQTIAVVDAYDDPTIASDLSSFSSMFGIPCNSCFTKVNQSGGSSYPSVDSGWALEIALDVEWAHAIAPAAHILLVEASTSSFSNLLAAEDYASTHAQYVTNSWGASEFSGESTYDSHFATSGVSYFVSSGDTGGVVEYPAASPNVVAVGGTSLATSTESAWSSGGGGCSAYERANSAQVTAPGVSCGSRATPDVASDADPNSGVSVYDTTSYSGQSGWFQVGGTSAASPVWAARAADRGVQVNAAYVYAGYNGTTFPYGTDISYRDVTSGNNGYAAGTGYDLATGLGSWINGDSGVAPPTVSPAKITSKSCSGASCSFTGTGANPLNWTFGDGSTGSGGSVSHTYTAQGTYGVKLTAGDGTSDTASVTCTLSSTKKRSHLTCS
ncbi:MAG TPA: S53 family peptidase [Acidimicrobiales bacterium]|nr:S53 family peptidase [Acidimicrobiales bacterium]